MERTIESALAFGAQHLLVSAVLCGISLLLMRFRALNAELRSWMLLATFALAVLLPCVSFLPDHSIHASDASEQSAQLAGTIPRPGEGARLDEPVYEAGQRPGMMYLEIPRSPVTLLTLAWVLGALWQLMRLFDGWHHARRLSRSARPALLLEASLSGVLPRGARICTTAVDGPMVVGLLRPCILIPRVLVSALEPNALSDILRHEIAHVRRGDLWLATMLRMALAVFWWNPFLRMINARLELAREMACDARAAQACDARIDYASSLLESAEKMLDLEERRTGLAVGMFEHRSHLTQRIDGLIEVDEVDLRRRVGTMMLCASLLSACIGAAVATMPRIDLPLRNSAEPDVQVTALIAAAKAGDSSMVRDLVRSGVDLNARVLGDGTALIMAVSAGKQDVVDTLLELGADPNRASLGEGSPLIVASELGLQPIVERLVRAGAEVNRVVTYDETPLINAAREGHLTTVKYLIAKGADVNLGVVADGWLGRWRSPLNQATDPAVRDYLISRGAVAGSP